MGQTSAALRGQPLVHELAPECLAMCGICAGDPEKVSLGDIIVANQLWPYDEGKQTDAGFYHAMKLFQLERTWGMDAAFAADWIDVEVLAQGRPPTKDAQTRWLLHALYAHQFDRGPSAADHPTRKHDCPSYTQILKAALDAGLVTRQGRSILLTDTGKDRVDEDVMLHPDGTPSDPKHRIHIRAMATGSAVIEDETIFRRLQRINRETIALDMEGAAIAELAVREEKRFLVVKAVQDFANGQKDDTFRAFGCRASAMFLVAFLQKYLEPKRNDYVHVIDADRCEFDRERENPFVGRVERAAALKHPKAKITRRRVDPPFAGVLELDVDEGGLSEIKLVAALDAPITADFVVAFAMDIERPFRERYPLLRSTIVHLGNAAPQDLRTDAFRKGITLESFREYQGLFDMQPYLEWQTTRLLQSTVYPPDMYVDAPAEYQVFGSRAWTKIEKALEYLLELLQSSDQRQFALVLGDFGAGKTFLLREWARRMHVHDHGVWPVLLEMHSLEKRHDLPALLGAHFGQAHVPGYNFRAFQYMLNEGRIALLFDGFDELADRVTFDTVTDHLNTVLSAVQGDQAKVVLSSRRQHFLSEAQAKEGLERQYVKLALTKQAEQVPGFRLVMLKPFGEPQIRYYLRNALQDENAANERYALIDEVKDLLGLSENPRMLGFIAKIPAEKLREAKRNEEGKITSATLYDELVKHWLDGEQERLRGISTQKTISRRALEQGVTALAMLMWQSRLQDVVADSIRDVLVEAMRTLAEPPLDVHVITHLFLSGSLFVRDADGNFAFVHRSVMEWFVARDAARNVEKGNHSPALEADEMSPLMADFFADMTGREHALAWAVGKAASHETGVVVKNAALVRQRIEKRWEVQPIAADAISVIIDYSGQDFRGQDLTGVDWRNANLSGANLESATLVGANLSGANLTGARLVRADLMRAKLVGARLEAAKLGGARLVQADLSKSVGVDSAKLFRTNLAGATISEGVVVAADPLGAPSVLIEARPMWEAVAAPCYGVAYGGNGELLAAAFGDATVRLFDAVTGQLLRVMSGHQGSVRSVAFSRDGTTIATGSDDTTVRIWNAGSGICSRVIEGNGHTVTSVALSKNGKTVCSGSHDNTVRLWDVGSGHALRAPMGHSQPVTSVALSNDGETMASSSEDKTLRVWDASSGRWLQILNGHSYAVWSVAVSDDGTIIASGSSDKTVRLWEAASGRSLHVFQGHSSAVTSVALSNDAKTVVSGSYDNTVRIWDAASGRSVSFEGHSNGVTSTTLPVPDALISARADG